MQVLAMPCKYLHPPNCPRLSKEHENASLEKRGERVEQAHERFMRGLLPTLLGSGVAAKRLSLSEEEGPSGSFM